MAIDVRLAVPNLVTVNLEPPIPNHVPIPVPIAVFLTNTDGAVAHITAPTPCDIHYWEVYDSRDVLVQAEPPELCIQLYQRRPIGPGETIRGDNSIILEGRNLRDGERYTVRYKFWGQPCEDQFVAQVVV